MLHGTGIFTYIPPKFMLNVGKKFQSHGACGILMKTLGKYKDSGRNIE